MEASEHEMEWGSFSQPLYVQYLDVYFSTLNSQTESSTLGQ